jgi:hypothetical protein
MRTYLILGLAALVTAALLFVVPLLPGATSLDASVPVSELAFANKVINAVQHGDATAVISVSQQGNEPPAAMIKQIATRFPKAPAVLSAVTSYSRKPLPGGTTADRLTIRLGYTDKSAMHVELAILAAGSAYTLAGATFDYLPPAAANANEFTFPGLFEGRTLLFILAIALDFAVLATFGLCAAGLGPSWRWRWLLLIAILIGVMRMNIDWVTGAWSVVPLTALLPPAGFYRFSLEQPWVLSLSFPIGTVLFWLFAARWRALRDAGASNPVRPE